MLPCPSWRMGKKWLRLWKNNWPLPGPGCTRMGVRWTSDWNGLRKFIQWMGTKNIDWLVLWNHGILWRSHHIGNGMSSSQLTLSELFFRGVVIPTTNQNISYIGIIITIIDDYPIIKPPTYHWMTIIFPTFSYRSRKSITSHELPKGVTAGVAVFCLATGISQRMAPLNHTIAAISCLNHP